MISDTDNSFTVPPTAPPSVWSTAGDVRILLRLELHNVVVLSWSLPTTNLDGFMWCIVEIVLLDGLFGSERTIGFEVSRI